MPPLTYCDNNFVITAHDAPAEYKAHLRALASSGKVRYVLSPWHWREMAQDGDHARGVSVADFCDSLGPVWLYDRRSIQRREVAAALYRFANIQAEIPVMASLAIWLIFFPATNRCLTRALCGNGIEVVPAREFFLSEPHGSPLNCCDPLQCGVQNLFVIVLPQR